jgi:hypothetical protein
VEVLSVLIVKVLQGESPSDAQPIVVTSSLAVVRAVGRAIAEELGAESPEARALSLVRGDAPEITP